MENIKDFKLLTIIIPSFNRCNQLIENVNLVMSQVLRHTDQVRLYISDNASTDGTFNEMKKCQDKYPIGFSYYRQPENITASPNFNHAVHAVNSEYVYILGDDDYIVPTFVETVLALIKEYPDVGLFHFNYLLGFHEMKKSKVFQQNITPAFRKLYPTGKEFVWEQLQRPSFVSSSLFKRQLWLDGVPYMKEDCSGYVWFSILLHGCLKYKCMYYEAPMLVQNFPTNCPYFVNWALYYINGLGNLFHYLDEYIPGVYEHWRDYQQKEAKIDFLIAISTVSHAKNKYKERHDMILKHIRSRKDRFFYYLCSNYIPALLCEKLIVPMIKILKLKTILH